MRKTSLTDLCHEFRLKVRRVVSLDCAYADLGLRYRKISLSFFPNVPLLLHFVQNIFALCTGTIKKEEEAGMRRMPDSQTSMGFIYIEKNLKRSAHR